MNDYVVIVNDQQFNVNFSLLCCLSEKFLHLKKSDQPYIFSIPEEYFNCFASFMGIFQGKTFCIDDFNYLSLIFLIDLLELKSLSDFLNDPNIFHQYFIQHFDEQLKFIIQYFDRFPIESINLFSVSQLLKIILSEDFQIQNEDRLFSIITNLIQIDKGKNVLLKLIYFPFVSSSLLKDFFMNFPLEKIGSFIFESLKPRILCDVLNPNLPPTSRWKEIPKSFTQKKLEKLFLFFIHILVVMET